MVHQFDKSLAFSHAAEDLPFWEEVYRCAFPTMVAMANHRQDGPHQRSGIDRSILLANSKQFLIDEKVRGRNRITGRVYEDIALEFLSDEERNQPGWVTKPLLADYIAYAIAPLGRCYLLPVPQLQQAWTENGERWRDEARRLIRAPNLYHGRRWVTVSVGVTPRVLFHAMGQCLRVRFNPFEFEEDEEAANGKVPGSPSGNPVANEVDLKNERFWEPDPESGSW